ncbi:MAG: Txe/YoeB family addiction module toxin [Bacteroidetes bacterium]|nr:Txe/YoeB family addiction module toxin [Bacteroidota bacterium]
MRSDIVFSDLAKKDIEFHQKAGNLTVLRKINTLILEIIENPFSGTGKPEALKYELTGKWSRRINREHRLIYSVTESTIYIYSAKGHYFD